MNHLKTLKRLALVAVIFATGYASKLSAQAPVSSCAASNEITITVNPVLTEVAGSLVGFTECVDGTRTLTISTTGGSGGTLTYAWQQSDTGLANSWSAAAGTNNAVIYTPVSTAPGTTFYRVIVTDPATGASACGSVTSASATVVVQPDLSFATNLPTTPYVECVGGALTTLTVNVTGGSGITGALTYIWEESDGNAPYAWHAAPSATNSNTYTRPSNAVGTKYYRVRLTDTGDGCGANTSAVATITVNPQLSFTAGNDLTGITECISGTDQLSVTVTGGSGGALVYIWEESDGNAPYSWHAAPGAPVAPAATFATYTPPSTTAGTKYYRVRVTDAGTGCGALTNNTPATVEVRAKPAALVVSASETAVCNDGSVTFTSTTPGGVGCTVKWQSATATAPTVFSDLGVTGTTYTASGLRTTNSGAKYRAVVTCSGNGCCN